jgi:hypothetical protein
MKGVKLFTKIQVIQAIAFLLIPFVLWWINGERLDSISAYAHATPMPFAFSLTLAGSLFINDGIITQERWYNYIVGFSLFGVILFTNTAYPVTHYIFASIFFLGSLFNMVFFSSDRERLIKSFVVVGAMVGLFGGFFLNWYSIFWAEFIGMIPISVHYVLEALDKID